MNRRHLLALLFFLPAIASCEPKDAMTEEAKQPAPAPKVPEGAEVIILGAARVFSKYLRESLSLIHI